MNRCASCKHWQSFEQFEADNQPVPPALSGPWTTLYDVPEDQRKKWGQCQLIPLGYKADISAFCKDGSDYMADFNTREDFGCTEWEGK